MTSRQISIETVVYPIDLIEGILETFDFSVCLDLGHLILYGYSTADYVNRYLAQTIVVHLHGVRNGRDHLKQLA